MPLRIGILGGTGLYEWGRHDPIEVETPTRTLTLQHVRGPHAELFFLPRHGSRHETSPHDIDHAAHVHALAAARCDYVLGLNNVGSLRADLAPGQFVVPRDLLDFHRTQARPRAPGPPVHVPFDAPYCPTLSERLATTKKPPLARAVYAGTDGPRFETPAEVQFLARAGADVVGMTGVPEVVAARERGLCYASLAFVGNYASGLGPGTGAKAIQSALRRRALPLRRLVSSAIRRLPKRKTCSCQAALQGAALYLGGRAR